MVPEVSSSTLFVTHGTAVEGVRRLLEVASPLGRFDHVRAAAGFPAAAAELATVRMLRAR